MKAPSLKPAKTPVKVPSCAFYARRESVSWREKIQGAEASSIWNELHRLVRNHPMVRTALGEQQKSPSSTVLITLHDLTQDLYMLLLQKNRFDHYIDAGMADDEIEREIYQIELTNMLIGGLRRRRPENYRLARRIGAVLETNPRFRHFRQGKGRKARYRQASEAVFGLREWEDSKAMRDTGTYAELISSIPLRRRNRRRTGCTGEAQLIVSNTELVDLMVEILEAIDSPATLKVLRNLALSRLPLYDPVMSSIDDELSEDRQGAKFINYIASSAASPEKLVLLTEEERLSRIAANRFLEQLSGLVRFNPARTETVWKVFWHSYFDPSEPSQMEISALVGMSDSTVSEYRKKIDAELGRLSSRISEEVMRVFYEELDEQLRWRLCLNEYINRVSEVQSDLEWVMTEVKPAKEISATVDLLHIM